MNYESVFWHLGLGIAGHTVPALGPVHGADDLNYTGGGIDITDIHPFFHTDILYNTVILAYWHVIHPKCHNVIFMLSILSYNDYDLYL